jgi:hypothetical protein
MATRDQGEIAGRADRGESGDDAPPGYTNTTSTVATTDAERLVLVSEWTNGTSETAAVSATVVDPPR